MRKFLLLSLALALLLPAKSALAIGEQYGRITGIVYNQDGAVLAGVTLTLKSSALIGGSKKLATSGEGSFTFNNLPPGKYSLLVEQPGLKTIDKRNIVISVGKTISLYLVMNLPTAEEDIEVIRERPVVDTTDTTLGGTFSAEISADVPTGRSYQDIAEFLPGVVDVNGGNPDIHGGTFRNNRYLVDGLDITDPVTLTFSSNINFDAIQEVEVLTGGLSAEYNALGGIINVVTKSGGNDFELDASYYVSNKTLAPVQDFGIDALNGTVKQRAIDTTIFATSQANVNAGGPIIKDKLWYYVSLQKDDTILSDPVAPPFFVAHPPIEAHGLFGRVKLTYQPSQNNTITLAYSTDPLEFTNFTRNSFRFVDPSCAIDPEGDLCQGFQDADGNFIGGNAEDRRVQGGFFSSVRLDSVISENMLFKAQVGLSKGALIGFPENTLFQEIENAEPPQDVFGNQLDPINLLGTSGAFPQPRLDISNNNVGGTRTMISNTLFEDVRTRLQMDSTLTYLLDNLFGSHEFKGGVQIAPTFNTSTAGTPGFVRLDDDGGEFVESPDGNGQRYVGACNASFNPLTRLTVFPNSRRDEGCVRLVTFEGDVPEDNPFTSFNTGIDAGVFVQDQWKPTPFLTIKPGLRFDAFSATNRTDANEDGIVNPEEVDKIISYGGIGPRLGVAWDPTHDGKTLLAGYVGQVTESGNLVIPSFAGRTAETNVFSFDATTGIYNIQEPSLTFGGDSGVILACDETLLDDPATAALFEECRPPVMRELSFIAERQVGDSTVLGVNGIFRRQFHMFEDDEANLIFDETGTQVIGGVNGNAAQSVFRVRTPDEAFVQYAGMDIYLRGKPSERSNIFASYTLSLTQGTKTEDTNTQFTFFMDNPRQNVFETGPLPSHRPHVLKLTGSYDFDFGLTLGASYIYQSGQSFDRFFFNDFFEAFQDRRAPRGFDPGEDVNDPGDDVRLRLPDLNQIDIRAQYSLAPLTGQKLVLIADVFNLLNLGTPTNVFQVDGEDFGAIIGRQGPLTVQLGIRYVY